MRGSVIGTVLAGALALARASQASDQTTPIGTAGASSCLTVTVPPGVFWVKLTAIGEHGVAGQDTIGIAVEHDRLWLDAADAGIGRLCRRRRPRWRRRPQQRHRGR